MRVPSHTHINKNVNCILVCKPRISKKVPKGPEQAFLNTVLSTCPTCYNHLSSHNGLTPYLGERLELFGDKPDEALLCGLLKSTPGPRHSGGTGHGPGRKGSTDTSSFSVVHFSFLPVPTGRRGKPFLSGYPRQRSKVGHKGRIPQGGRRADLPPPEAVCAGCLLRQQCLTASTCP